jgi:hypothetical protein
MAHAAHIQTVLEGLRASEKQAAVEADPDKST